MIGDGYYIQSDSGEFEGPLDLLMMIRHIKNGRLESGQLMRKNLDGEILPASSFDEINEIFEEEKQSGEVPSFTKARYDESFVKVLRSGWETLKLNQILAVVTGIFFIVATFGITVFSILLHGSAFGIVTVIWCELAFIFYLAAMLRKTRMQLLRADYFGALVIRHFPKLLVVACGVAFIPGIVPALAWPWLGVKVWLFVAIPGSLVFTWFIFVPLIIVDREIGIMAAFALNRQVMRRVGLNGYEVMYFLVVLNVIALPLFPLVMPVTFGALCEFYDRQFNEI